jgi:hypothetical protein
MPISSPLYHPGTLSKGERDRIIEENDIIFVQSTTNPDKYIVWVDDGRGFYVQTTMTRQEVLNRTGDVPVQGNWAKKGSIAEKMISMPTVSEKEIQRAYKELGLDVPDFANAPREKINATADGYLSLFKDENGEYFVTHPSQFGSIQAAVNYGNTIKDPVIRSEYLKAFMKYWGVPLDRVRTSLPGDREKALSILQFKNENDPVLKDIIARFKANPNADEFKIFEAGGSISLKEKQALALLAGVKFDANKEWLSALESVGKDYSKGNYQYMAIKEYADKYGITTGEAMRRIDLMRANDIKALDAIPGMTEAEKADLINYQARVDAGADYITKREALSLKETSPKLYEILSKKGTKALEAVSKSEQERQDAEFQKEFEKLPLYVQQEYQKALQRGEDGQAALERAIETYNAFVKRWNESVSAAQAKRLMEKEEYEKYLKKLAQFDNYRIPIDYAPLTNLFITNPDKYNSLTEALNVPSYDMYEITKDILRGKLNRSDAEYIFGSDTVAKYEKLINEERILNDQYGGDIIKYLKSNPNNKKTLLDLGYNRNAVEKAAKYAKFDIRPTTVEAIEQEIKPEYQNVNTLARAQVVRYTTQAVIHELGYLDDKGNPLPWEKLSPAQKQAVADNWKNLSVQSAKGLASLVFTPAQKGLGPEGWKAVTPLEWALGAAEIITWATPFLKIPTIPLKLTQAGATAIFTISTALAAPKMIENKKYAELAFALAMDAFIGFSALPTKMQAGIINRAGKIGKAIKDVVAVEDGGRFKAGTKQSVQEAVQDLFSKRGITLSSKAKKELDYILGDIQEAILNNRTNDLVKAAKRLEGSVAANRLGLETGLLFADNPIKSYAISIQANPRGFTLFAQNILNTGKIYPSNLVQKLKFIDDIKKAVRDVAPPRKPMTPKEILGYRNDPDYLNAITKVQRAKSIEDLTGKTNKTYNLAIKKGKLPKAEGVVIARPEIYLVLDKKTGLINFMDSSDVKLTEYIAKGRSGRPFMVLAEDMAQGEIEIFRELIKRQRPRIANIKTEQRYKDIREGFISEEANKGSSGLVQDEPAYKQWVQKYIKALEDSYERYKEGVKTGRIKTHIATNKGGKIVREPLETFEAWISRNPIKIEPYIEYEAKPITPKEYQFLKWLPETRKRMGIKEGAQLPDVYGESSYYTDIDAVRDQIKGIKNIVEQRGFNDAVEAYGFKRVKAIYPELSRSVLTAEKAAKRIAKPYQEAMNKRVWEQANYRIGRNLMEAQVDSKTGELRDPSALYHGEAEWKRLMAKGYLDLPVVQEEKLVAWHELASPPNEKILSVANNLKEIQYTEGGDFILIPEKNIPKFNKPIYTRNTRFLNAVLALHDKYSSPLPPIENDKQHERIQKILEGNIYKGLYVHDLSTIDNPDDLLSDYYKGLAFEENEAVKDGKIVRGKVNRPVIRLRGENINEQVNNLIEDVKKSVEKNGWIATINYYSPALVKEIYPFAFEYAISESEIGGEYGTGSQGMPKIPVTPEGLPDDSMALTRELKRVGINTRMPHKGSDSYKTYELTKTGEKQILDDAIGKPLQSTESMPAITKMPGKEPGKKPGQVPSSVPAPNISPSPAISPQASPVKVPKPTPVPQPVLVPTPAPIPEPAPQPQPLPEPVREVIDTPMPVSVPEQVPTLQPIPERTPEKGEIIEERKSSTGKGDIEKRRVIENSYAATTFKTGALKIAGQKKSVWQVFFKPSKGAKWQTDTLVGDIPRGAYYASGPESAYRTIQRLSGNEPINISKDVGAFLATVIAKEGQKPQLIYSRDTEQQRRIKQPVARIKEKRYPVQIDLGAGVVQEGKRRHIKI